MRRVPSLADFDTGVDREVGSNFDTIKIVADNIDAILSVLANAEYTLKYLGAFTSVPLHRQDNTPIENGDYFFDTAQDLLLYFDMGDNSWIAVDPVAVKTHSDAAEAAVAVAEAARDAAITARDTAEGEVVKAVDETTKATAQADRATTEADRAEAAADVASSGGLPEAPEDGGEYVRKDADWHEVSIPDAGIPEAPNDGNQYVRMSEAWSELNIPDAGIIEAPEDGKQYARKDASWEEVVASDEIPDFKMEDATDAELNIEVSLIPEQGLQWDLGTVTDPGSWVEASPFGIGNGIRPNPEDKNGVVTDLLALNGYTVDIISTTMGDFLNVTLEAIDISGAYILLRFDGIPSHFGSGSITILDAGAPVEVPLQDDDVWVYNKAVNRFKPKQILAQGKLEDANDVELNSTSSAMLYRWGGIYSVTASGGTGRISIDIDGVTTAVVSVNGTDLDGNTLDAEALDGTTIGISIDGGDIEFATIAAKLLNDSFPTYYLLWDNVDAYTDTNMILSIYGTDDVPLQDGDALVYNSNKQKFKPTPTVPIIKVTELPASPDANTLYIRVV